MSVEKSRSTVGLAILCVVLMVCLAGFGGWTYARMDSLQKQITDLEAQNEQFQTQVADLENQVSSLEVEVRNLTNTIKAMANVTFTFMQTEELAFTSYTWDTASPPAWVQITVKNTGSADMTISEVRINDVACADDGITTPYSLAAGDTVTLNVTRTGGYTSGVKYEFTVISAKGNTFGPYIKTAP